MKLKTKLASLIIGFVMVASMLFFGVWAASSANVTLGGTISFKSTNVYATVEATIEGAVGATNPDTLTFSSETPNPDTSSWSKNLEFDENGSMITINITITNLATDRPLYASVTDNYGVVTNLDKTISAGANALTLEAKGSTDDLGEATDTATVTITLKVQDTDDSLSGASYGYFVDLNSEAAIDTSLLIYTTGGTTATITGISDATATGRLVIPSEIVVDGTTYTVTTIGECAFENSNITSVIVPSSVTTIVEGAFNMCTSLRVAVINANITVINPGTFANCFSLEELTLPASLTSVQYDAVAETPKLANIYFKGTEEQWNSIEISDANNDSLFSATIHYGA